MEEPVVEEVVGPGRITPFMRQASVVLGVMLYVMSTGCAIGFPAVLLPQLREPASGLHLSTADESWIASLLGFGLLSGILVVPALLERWGRRRTNLLSTLPAIVGWALLPCANGAPLLLLGRFLQGFAMGLQAPAGPLTIGECAAPALRGVFLSGISVSFASGMFASHALGTLWPWRVAALACAAFPATSLVVLALASESPAWLASRARYDRCRTSFHRLRGHSAEAERELNIMIADRKQRRKVADGTGASRTFAEKAASAFQAAKRSECYRPIGIMMILFMLFQFSGATVVPSYSTMIVEEVANGAVDPQVGTLIIDAVRLASTLLACAVVQHYPRRLVLFVSCIGSVGALLAAAGCLYLRIAGLRPAHDWAPIAATLLYVFGMTMGIMPIPWAIAGEIFPSAYRSFGSGASGVFLALMFFGAIKSAPYLFAGVGVRGAFLVYAAFISVCAVCLFRLLPETKGRTLDDIEKFFRGADGDDQPSLAHVKDKMLKPLDI